MPDELFKTLQKQAKHQTHSHLFYNEMLLKKRLICLFVRHYPKLFCAASLIILLIIFASINILKTLF